MKGHEGGGERNKEISNHKQTNQRKTVSTAFNFLYASNLNKQFNF